MNMFSRLRPPPPSLFFGGADKLFSLHLSRSLIAAAADGDDDDDDDDAKGI